MLLIIKSFENKLPIDFSMLRDMNSGILDHLGITSWKIIDKRWIVFEQVLRGPALTKIWSDVHPSHPI